MIKHLDITNEEIANQILDISLKAYREESKIIDYQDFPPLKEKLETLMKSKTSFYGYLENEKILGAIEIETKSSSAWISRLVVEPKNFKKGIASSLLTEVLNIFQTLHVGTAEKNSPAINLYKKFGFKYKATKIVGLPPVNWVVYYKQRT